MSAPAKPPPAEATASGARPDVALTARVKGHALGELGADLVGIADVGRFRNAPERMSPQGIMPDARSVVVMALHHPDGCVEMGGREHPQEIGPYRVQYWMNSVLDEISYRMALFLERSGFRAVPIASSNIWRYKGYRDMTENFAPDLSHMHAAVAAGLAEFGYSGLAITPEYGARQRYVTVVTDAVLAPSPLLEPGTVCDGCDLCVKHCMSGALSKEIDGENVVEIEGNRYTYARKNLWRCAWGEHFDLDLDLPIPERVDEDVILAAIEEHGFRGGEMGSCLRYCVPREQRYFDRRYTSAPRRRRPSPASATRSPAREIIEAARARGVDFAVVRSADDLSRAGIDLAGHLPDAASALTLGLHFAQPQGDDRLGHARRYVLEAAAFDAARALERLGHSSVCCTDLDAEAMQAGLEGVLPGRAVMTTTVVTSAPLESTPLAVPPPERGSASPAELAREIKSLARTLGADLCGVSPAERLAEVVPELERIFAGMEYLVARDRSSRFRPYEPEVERRPVEILSPSDHLPGAKSVVVIGLRLPAESVARTAKPPAEAVGPYAFCQYESERLLATIAMRAARMLEDAGFRAAAAFDLSGTGSSVGNPRGEQPDAFCNRFAAVAAGLGRLGRGGFVITPEFGPNVRFVAVVTDAELTGDPPGPAGHPDACRECRRCVEACSTRAFGGEVALAVGGSRQEFTVLDRARCDWAKRYSLVGSEGGDFTGYGVTVSAPAEIDEDSLASALRLHHPIAKYRPCNFEACVMACPLAREQPAG